MDVSIYILFLFVGFASGVAILGYWLTRKDGETPYPSLMLFASASIFLFIFASITNIDMGNQIETIEPDGNGGFIITYGRELVPLGDFRFYFLIPIAFLLLVAAFSMKLFDSQKSGTYIDSL